MRPVSIRSLARLLSGCAMLLGSTFAGAAPAAAQVPLLSVDPTQLNFPDQRVGVSSRGLTVQVGYQANNILFPSSVTVHTVMHDATGSFPVLSNTCNGRALRQQESCLIGV